MADVVCPGELLIDFVPTVTGTGLIEALAFKKAPGGVPANVAVGLARLGVASAFMGKVGDDAFGDFLEDTLVEAGVRTEPFKRSATARTALAFVSLRSDGEREFMFYRHPSADMLFDPKEVDEAAIRAAKLLHYGTISLVDEPARSATLRAIDIARDSDCLVSCDPNLWLALWPDEETAKQGLKLGIAKAGIVKISDDECRFLTGSDDPKVARGQLWHDDLALMVVTQGAGGGACFTKELEGRAAGFEVTAVDATRAGDGFVASLLHGILNDPAVLDDGQRLQDLCRFANAVGAIATTGRGAIPSLPTKDRVHAFMAQQSAG